MGIDMSIYKMIYKDQVFNVLGINPIYRYCEEENRNKIIEIEATFINENGEIDVVFDKVNCFKFVKR